MIAQVIAACLNAVETIVDKIVLSRHRVEYKRFIIAVFLFLWFFTSLTLPWLGKVDYVRAISASGIFFFIMLIIFAFIWNALYYRSQQHETVQEFEIIVMTLPLFTSLMAAIFFPDERNWHILIATVIASSALILSHLRRDHFSFDKYSWWLIVAVFFWAAESLVRKVLLEYYSPASLYFFRTAILTILFIIVWHPKSLSLPKKSLPHIILSGALGSAMMILTFYGYRDLGVVLTTLVLMLGPILTYLLDFIVLKEKLRPRIIIAAGVILGCIIYAGVMA